MALYDQIGSSYDTTRRADPYIVRRLLHHLVPQSAGEYLDVGCGTGNYTIALFNAGIHIQGLDQSNLMLTIAQAKSNQLKWTLGNAETLPFTSDIFWGAICTLAIHHFTNLGRAFQEVYRVLAHGRFIIFTCTPEQVGGYWLNAYFPGAMAMIMEYMPSLDSIVQHLYSAGFVVITIEPYNVQNDLQDHFLYSKKSDPTAYLDPYFRKGMSVFAAKANTIEIEQGCMKLLQDIETGHIRTVIDSYRHARGDYLFVVAEKVACE